MEENIVDFEEYGIKIDLNEIENMDETEVKKCMAKILEIKKMIEAK